MTYHNDLIQFWEKIALKKITWQKTWDAILEGNLGEGNARWFTGAKLNACENCVDRHLKDKSNHPAIIWEGDEPNQSRILSFADLHKEICQMANIFKQLGLKKGDKIGIYLPLIPEAAVAMLAAARLGLVHTVVFAGFSAEALAERLKTADCKLLVTADGFYRGGKHFSLKKQADEALKQFPIPMLLIKDSAENIDFNPRTNYWWHELKNTVETQCDIEPMDSEDPLFILYTSGSTGTPKGLVHTTGGYLTQVAFSHEHIFNCQQDEVFWCTADIGWITGHSYLVYGPLANGITTFMFGGTPTYPTPARFWQLVDKYKINVLYTAPTAIRALKKEGDEWLDKSTRGSLRLLGSVGEPINPEAWHWYYEKVGFSKSPIVDTWWQTETGAVMICPNGEENEAKPGAACKPLPGIYPVLLDEQDNEIEGEGSGFLAIKYPWPSLARTIATNHERYLKAYFKNGYYITGDGARRDKDGDYWITGRIDDVLNVSGHRLGTAEIESALAKHKSVAEAAVVGIPHPIKGQGIHAFICLKDKTLDKAHLQEELLVKVSQTIGALAKPDVIQWVEDLPKTRSGKIMRRILRLFAENKIEQLSDLGDLSTLANPLSIEGLMKKEKPN